MVLHGQHNAVLPCPYYITHKTSGRSVSRTMQQRALTEQSFMQTMRLLRFCSVIKRRKRQPPASCDAGKGHKRHSSIPLHHSASSAVTGASVLLASKRLMRLAFCELHRFRICHLIVATLAALPSQTAARQIITESAAFSAAAMYLPFSINFKLSSENVENVVKPPQKPVWSRSII